MNIHEYQAKAVLREFGVPVPRGVAAFTVDEAIKGSQLVRKIMGSAALRAITVEETKPGSRVQTEADMLQFFRDEAGSIYHLCGSCAMVIVVV